MELTGLNPIKIKRYGSQYFKVFDSTVMPCDSVEQIISAESLINKYAKLNNVQIRIFDPRHMCKLQKYAPGSDLAACVGIAVSDIKTLADNKYDVVDYFKNQDVPFLKRVLLSIQKLVSGEGTLPIEREKAKMLSKLKEIGKIKG